MCWPSIDNEDTKRGPAVVLLILYAILIVITIVLVIILSIIGSMPGGACYFGCGAGDWPLSMGPLGIYVSVVIALLFFIGAMITIIAIPTYMKFRDYLVGGGLFIGGLLIVLYLIFVAVLLCVFDALLGCILNITYFDVDWCSTSLFTGITVPLVFILLAVLASVIMCIFPNVARDVMRAKRRRRRLEVFSFSSESAANLNSEVPQPIVKDEENVATTGFQFSVRKKST